ncbi:hypothetical protein [Roseimaritima sediminicola]|uniref:hypothetical protein n=1 Tax=Roseimaritima sediminicola TaxID=2662066 RepID=UPI0012982D7C|nr:hypothetical protein [Roseimaritima sediminicola]
MNDKRPAWHLLRWIPVTILLAAAVSKALYAPEFVSMGGLLSFPAVLLGVVFVEFACAISIAGLGVRASWAVTVSLFSGLFLVAAYAQFSGVSCNCFGGKVPPVASLVVDVGVLCLCLAFRPVAPTARQPTTSVVLILAGVLGIGGAAYVNYRLTTVDRTDPLKFLLAGQLVGRLWPLDSSRHPQLEVLESGSWLAVVIRRDCEHCKLVLETHFKDPQRHRPGERTVLFVAGENDWPFSLDTIQNRAEPTGVLKWEQAAPFVASPAVFEIDEGRITRASDGQAADEFLETLFAGDHSGKSR